MKLQRFSFHDWLKAKSHQDKGFFDKWSREVYPWLLFNEIDFDVTLINQPQIINIEDISYQVTLLSIASSFEDRVVSEFRVEVNFEEEHEKWENREWNDIFKIVFSPEGKFITAHMKDFDNQDKYKRYLRYFREGNFDMIIENRNLQLLFLLFRTLTSLIIEENHPEAHYLERFKYDSRLFTGGAHSWKWNEIAPLWSEGRERWFFASRTEEKAHRLGIRLAGQCKRLTIIYCKPVHTSYEICAKPGVDILSLMEYSEKVNSNSRFIYERHILLLLNQLRKVDDRPTNHILQQIGKIEEGQSFVRKEDLREAKVISPLPVYNIFDAFYSISCALVFNTWQDYTKEKEDTKNFKYRNDKNFRYNPKVYAFKSIIPDRINDIINNGIENIQIYYEKYEDYRINIVFIRIFGFQYSFHVVPEEKLIDFINSDKNIHQEWSGKRLKPVAILLLILSRKVYYWSKDIVNRIIITADIYCAKNADWIDLSDLEKNMNKYFHYGYSLSDLLKTIEKEKKIFEIADDTHDKKLKFRIIRRKFSDEDRDLYNFIIDNYYQ